MNRLKLKPTKNRDSIRYRLHTSIQAAAYLADDPGHDVIDRELGQIMRPGQPKASHDRDREHVDCLCAERPAHGFERTSVGAAFGGFIVITTVLGAVTALLVYLEGSRAFITLQYVAIGVPTILQALARVQGPHSKSLNWIMRRLGLSRDLERSDR
jgi:hypothetical protein